MKAVAGKALAFELADVKGMADVHFRADRLSGLVDVARAVAEVHGAHGAQAEHHTGIDAAPGSVDDVGACGAEAGTHPGDDRAVAQNVPAGLVPALSQVHVSVLY